MKNDFIERWKKEKKSGFEEGKRFLEALRKKNSSDIDHLASTLHEKAFSKIDCLTCANCCKSTPAILKNADIKRIAKFLKITPKQFKYKYVIEDINGELSFRKVPCIFLQEDNKCSVYEVRPESCRDYPHTSGKDFLKRLNLHKENLEICPAVFFIVDLWSHP